MSSRKLNLNFFWHVLSSVPKAVASVKFQGGGGGGGCACAMVEVQVSLSFISCW